MEVAVVGADDGVGGIGGGHFLTLDGWGGGHELVGLLGRMSQEGRSADVGGGECSLGGDRAKGCGGEEDGSPIQHPMAMLAMRCCFGGGKSSSEVGKIVVILPNSKLPQRM